MPRGVKGSGAEGEDIEPRFRLQERIEALNVQLEELAGEKLVAVEPLADGLDKAEAAIAKIRAAAGLGTKKRKKYKKRGK